MKTKFTNQLSVLALTLLASSQAFALNPILRDFHSVRAAGMGDVRYTTGIFEENLYANPARSSDNPENLFQLPQLSFEASGATLGALNSLLKSGSNGLQAFNDNVGKPLSVRAQMVFPGYYNRHFIDPKMSFGLGLTVASQTIAEVSQSGNIDPTTLISAGPVVNLSRRFLEDDRLSVGVNLHAEFRANSKPNYSIEQYLAGDKIADVVKGGNGLGYDFDLGTTFKPHWTLGEFQYELAFAINNLMGGRYTQISHPISGWTGDPFQSRRSYNFGVSGLHDHFWFFKSILLAAELTDIGNNPNGSIYRSVHLGSEFKWKLLAARLGISQGYLSAGFGIDLIFFNLNIATYSEELGLNPGVMEDRRYAAQLGFEI
jgi:hypothetical protein